MLNQALNINKPQESKKSEEYTKEEYDQINKDITQALMDMKENKQDQEDDNNHEEKEDDKIDFFDKDFFSDSSNSVSFDSFSDFSEKTYKSANIEIKQKTIKNNINKDGTTNLNSLFHKEIPEIKNINIGKTDLAKKTEKNLNINLQNKDNRNNIILPNNNNNLNNLNNILINSNFNDNLFSRNSMNNQYISNNLNNSNMNMNLNINNNNNNINMMRMNNNNQNLMNYNLNNNQMNPLNNFPMNKNPNFNFQMNNNIINNPNFRNQKTNNYINNPSLYNINIINYNNSMNENNTFMKERKNNSALDSYPIISDRGVPGLYNLDSPKNIINLENILRNRDKRTTLIIRNIPNKYTKTLLIKELNENFQNKYDIVYLPQDYINNSNLGFGFINFVNPLHIILFYQEFVNKKWNYFNSKKRCNLAYSKYQGKNELIKYILTKLGISSLDNNSENIRKSFYIDNSKNLRAPIEIPINYFNHFISYHRFAVCHAKDNKVFIVDKYYNI